MNFSKLFPTTIYMNLDKRPDRKKLAEKEFEKIGIKPVRMPGVIFKGTSNERLNGILGCMFAHIECLHYGLERNTNIFIFEDDIKFLDYPNLKEIVDTASSELNDIEWDMFYLSANILRPFYQVSTHLAKLNHAQNTSGYGVNIKFIQKLLDYLPTNNITQPWIDVIYADTVIPNNNCYVTVPMVGCQRNNYSDIEQMEVRYEDYFQSRYDTNFVPMQNP